MPAVHRKLLAMAHKDNGIRFVETIKNSDLVQKTRITPAAEALRRVTIGQLKDHMEAFYQHGTLPDMLLLCAAFDHIERQRLDWSPERSWLIDALLMICNC